VNFFWGTIAGNRKWLRVWIYTSEENLKPPNHQNYHHLIKYNCIYLITTNRSRITLMSFTLSWSAWDRKKLPAYKSRADAQFHTDAHAQCDTIIAILNLLFTV
jgi:hypothetical protein